jgi:SAM-dependent methyltransferase
MGRVGETVVRGMAPGRSHASSWLQVANTFCFACSAPSVTAGDLVECTACGLSLRPTDTGIFLPVGGAVHSETIAYPEWGNAVSRSAEDGSFWFGHRNKVLGLIVRRYPFEGWLWDVGGGNGFQARMLEESGHSVVLVEPGPSGCRNARLRGVGHVIQSTLVAITAPDARLGAIALLDVIEHLDADDRAALLAESRRVLRPGGRLYVTVPAYPLLWSSEDEKAKHKLRYRSRVLKREIEQAGFRIDYMSYYFQCLVLPVILFRAIPSWLGSRTRTNRSKPADMSLHEPAPLVRSALLSLLEREFSRLECGESLESGASLIAVASRR